MMIPSGLNAINPASSVWTNSCRLWNCKMVFPRKVSRNSSASIWRADIRISATVCIWREWQSDEASITPTRRSSWSSTGLATQVRSLLPAKKCSGPWITVGINVSAAQPRALVPRMFSCHCEPRTIPVCWANWLKEESAMISKMVASLVAKTTAKLEPAIWEYKFRTSIRAIS